MTWQPGASLDSLKTRANILRQIRRFFDDRDVLEVETPLLTSAGVTDPHLVNFKTQYLLPGEKQGKTLFLQRTNEMRSSSAMTGSGFVQNPSHARD